jgi:hypothetical protein
VSVVRRWRSVPNSDPSALSPFVTDLVGLGSDARGTCQSAITRFCEDPRYIDESVDGLFFVLWALGGEGLYGMLYVYEILRPQLRALGTLAFAAARTRTVPDAAVEQALLRLQSAGGRHHT